MALRDLAYAYAHAIDNRLPGRFGSLFCDDGELVLPRPGGGSPVVLDGRDGWKRAFAVLAPYSSTSHFVGNQLVTITGDSATGETNCLAHELYDRDGVSRMLVRCVRYADSFLRVDGVWLFRRRMLTIDWLDDRELAEPSADLFRGAR